MDYVSKVREESLENARNLLNYDIPAKILELDELYNKLSKLPVEDFTTPLHSEKGEINTSVNTNFCKVRNELKKHLQEIMQWMITLSMCISLRVPKIEDGNNFGVNVQSTVREYISGIRNQTLECMKAATTFHQERGKRLSKCVKYPGIEDYSRSCHLADEQQSLHNLRVVNDLKHNLLWIYDICHKNWSKVVDPRGSLSSEHIL